MMCLSKVEDRPALIPTVTPHTYMSRIICIKYHKWFIRQQIHNVLQRKVEVHEYISRMFHGQNISTSSYQYMSKIHKLASTIRTRRNIQASPRDLVHLSLTAILPRT